MTVGLAVILTAAVAFANVTSDPWIVQRARMLLLLSPEVDATELHVDSTNGHVTLFGTVGTAAGGAAAERIVQQIIGVRSVRNLLVVVAPPARPAIDVADAILGENVALALRGDPALRPADIRVAAVDAGVVVLGGQASTLSQKYRALRVARGVPGVRRVASVIEGPEVLSDSEFWGDAAQARDAATADARLATAVKVRLITDQRLPPRAVAVDAQDGVVTLFGVAADEETKRTAEQIAAAVAGVREVHNQLLVRRQDDRTPTARAAGDVRAAVVAALDAVPPLADADLVVLTHDEVVELSGRVPTQADHLAALTVTREAAPGRTIVDALTVGPLTAATPTPPSPSTTAPVAAP